MELYEFTKTDVDVLSLNKKIKNNEDISKLCKKVVFKNPNKLKIYFNEALSSNEYIELQGIVGDHSNLEKLKADKIETIDAKTRELIAEGFSFDDEIFSLSVFAQSNWVELKALENIINWPVNISTMDNKTYSLTKGNLNNFIEAAFDIEKEHRDSGRILKIAGNSAQNQLDFDLIIDNR